MAAEICFVLVRPAVPENVGAAARALKTMGFSALRIVASAAHADKRARILAHASTDILDRIETYPDLGAALSDCDFRIATSAKRRHGVRYNLTPAQLRATLADKGTAMQRAAIVFGCEEAGLSNAELALCDTLTSIPLATAYPSLNLAQAVMLYAYELAELAALPVAPPVAAGEWRALKVRAQHLLARLAIAGDSKLAHWLDERCALLAQDDVHFLHTLLSEIEKKIGD
jgi:tRNA/rRNA methyltransferase